MNEQEDQMLGKAVSLMFAALDRDMAAPDSGFLNELRERSIEAFAAPSLEPYSQAHDAPVTFFSSIISKRNLIKCTVAAVILIALAISIPLLRDHKPGQGNNGIPVTGLPLDEVRAGRESDQIQKMYAANDIGGLVSMLSDGLAHSKVLAANYLAEIGDLTAVEPLENLSAQSDDPDNPFADAALQIKLRFEEPTPPSLVNDGNEAKPSSGAPQQPESTISVAPSAATAMSDSEYTHFLFVRADGDLEVGGTMTVVLAKITAEGIELHDIETAPERDFFWRQPLCVIDGVLYGRYDDGLVSLNLTTKDSEVVFPEDSILKLDSDSYTYDSGRLFGHIELQRNMMTLRVVDLRRAGYRDIVTLQDEYDRLAVSPDNKLLAYFSRDPNGYLLTVVDVESGDVWYPGKAVNFQIWSLSSTFRGPSLVWIDSERVLCMHTEELGEDPNSIGGTKAVHKLSLIDVTSGQMEDIVTLPGDPRWSFYTLTQQYRQAGPRVRISRDLGQFSIDLQQRKLIEDDTINGDYLFSNDYLVHDVNELGQVRRDHLRISPDGKRAIWITDDKQLFFHDSVGKTVLTVSQAYRIEENLLWLTEKDMQAKELTPAISEGWIALKGLPLSEKRQDQDCDRKHIDECIAFTLKTDKSTYRLYEPVNITFTLRNIGDTDIKVARPVVFNASSSCIVEFCLDDSSGRKCLECGSSPYGSEEEVILLKAGTSVSATEILEVPIVGEYRIDGRYEGIKEDRYHGEPRTEPVSFKVVAVDDSQAEQHLFEAKFERLMQKLRHELEISPNWRYHSNTIDDEIIGIPSMGPKAAPYLIRVLESEPNEVTRKLLFRALVAVAGVEQLPYFLQRLTNGGDAEAEAVSGWLYRIYQNTPDKSEEVLVGLVSGMSHPNSVVREEVIDKLTNIYDPRVKACFETAINDEEDEIRRRAARYLAAAEWLVLDQWLELAAKEPNAARYIAAQSIVGGLERTWNMTKGEMPKVTWQQASKNPETLEQYRAVVSAWQKLAHENLRFSEQYFEGDREHWLIEPAPKN